MEKVLEILKKEGRVSAAEIAIRLGRSLEDVEAQVKKLEEEKVILGYQAVVNSLKRDDGVVTGIIEVNLTPERGKGFDAIAERIYRFPEVKLCYLMSGAYDLLVMIEGHSLNEVAAFVSQRLATLDNVSSTSTHFILKKYKDLGVIMQDSGTQDRLPVSP